MIFNDGARDVTMLSRHRIFAEVILTCWTFLLRGDRAAECSQVLGQLTPRCHLPGRQSHRTSSSATPSS